MAADQFSGNIHAQNIETGFLAGDLTPFFVFQVHNYWENQILEHVFGKTGSNSWG